MIYLQSSCADGPYMMSRAGVNGMSEAEKLTASEETFCQEFVLNNEKAIDAWNVAYPDSKANINSRYVAASKMLASPKIRLRIDELKEAAREKATEAFTITVEQRLRWLKEITEAGLGDYIDQNGNKRRENLAAARAAVATMNDMIGVADGGKQNESQGVTIVIKRDDGARKVDVVEQ